MFVLGSQRCEAGEQRSYDGDLMVHIYNITASVTI